MALLQDYNKLFEYTDNIKKIYVNNSVVWPAAYQMPDPKLEPFYVENISDVEETLNIRKISGAAPTLTIEYSTDKSTWTTFGTTSTTALTKPIAPGEKIYLKCTADKWVNNSYRNAIYGVSKIGGNIMSLLYGDNFADKTTFPTTNGYEFGSNIFSDATTNMQLKDISKLLLPATTMNTRSYYSLFSGCIELTLAPELPATTLANMCYSNMFSGCTSLTTVPDLPATTLADDCYKLMFQGCSSLTSAPELPATTLTTDCYWSMFQGCSSLTSAPELPATTLVSGCYLQMFNGCSSLSNVTCLATSGIALSSTSRWLYKVSSTGTFTKAANVTWPTGANGIPSGWTVIEV